MPLLDHFTAPVPRPRRWESFHGYWVPAIGGVLNRTLPSRFYAAVDTHLGAQVSADVAEFDHGPPAGANGAGGGVVVHPYTAPPATGTMPAVFPDSAAIPVVDTDLDRLVGVVELVSPSNKHGPDDRRAFAAKCAGYTQAGVGVVVIDVVFRQHFNLHDELVDLLRLPPALRMDPPADLYIASYRPVSRDGTPRLDYWLTPVAVGAALPTVPFALKGWGVVPLDLEEAYNDACQVGRVT